MSLQRVVPCEGKVVMMHDGSKMTGPAVVDTSLPFYKRRIEEGAIKPWSKPKQKRSKE